jgi:hypothetical protein
VGSIHLYQDWTEWQAVVNAMINLLVARNAGDLIDRSSKSLISGLFVEVDDNCALLGYYAVSNGNFLQTFRDNVLGPTR